MPVILLLTDYCPTTHAAAAVSLPNTTPSLQRIHALDGVVQFGGVRPQLLLPLLSAEGTPLNGNGGRSSSPCRAAHTTTIFWCHTEILICRLPCTCHTCTQEWLCDVDMHIGCTHNMSPRVHCIAWSTMHAQQAQAKQPQARLDAHLV
jgi:hypothetical protein